jgi:hypothetical protein
MTGSMFASVSELMPVSARCPGNRHRPLRARPEEGKGGLAVFWRPSWEILLGARELPPEQARRRDLPRLVSILRNS